MRKYLLVLTGVLFIPLFSFCQHWEVGGMLGASNYCGDLSEDIVTINETHFAFGALVRYNVNKKWTLKGNVYYGTISGNDSNGTSIKHKQRNLSFRSEVLDIGANIEYNILGYEAGGRKNHFTPYIFTGFSVFRFNPEAFYTPPGGKSAGSYIALQPLGTEGQNSTTYNNRTKYNLTQISLPFGFGFKFNVFDNWNIGYEFGWRKTFTDYLDDVSGYYPTSGTIKREGNGGGAAGEYLSNPAYHKGTPETNPLYTINSTQKVKRGDPTTDDWYIFTGITISYTFLPAICPSF
jgi:hypothetical protein